MKAIRCHGCESHILVDDQDFDKVLKAGKWRCKKRVVQSRFYNSLGRFILGPPPQTGLWIDHINRNIHDNQRSNLRYVTPAQSARNRTTRNQYTA